jgi:hypothetical protein
MELNKPKQLASPKCSKGRTLWKQCVHSNNETTKTGITLNASKEITVTKVTNSADEKLQELTVNVLLVIYSAFVKYTVSVKILDTY